MNVLRSRYIRGPRPLCQHVYPSAVCLVKNLPSLTDVGLLNLPDTPAVERKSPTASALLSVEQQHAGNAAVEEVCPSSVLVDLGVWGLKAIPGSRP